MVARRNAADVTLMCFTDSFPLTRALRYWRSLQTIPHTALRTAPRSSQSRPLLHRPHLLFPRATQCQHPLHLLRCHRRRQPPKIMPVPTPATSDVHLLHQEVSALNLISLFLNPFYLTSFSIVETIHLLKRLKNQATNIFFFRNANTYFRTVIPRKQFGVNNTI